MDHRRAGKVEWVDAPSENFTGRVRFGPLSDQGPIKVFAMEFEATARTDWHSHPEGQVLYVVEGLGRIQDHDGATVEFGAGDVLYTPPGQVHWHGAGPDGPMTHFSLTTGGATIWEPRKVTEEEYGRKTPVQVPRERDIMLSVLQALGAIGGSGKPKEVITGVGGMLGVTGEQWSSKVNSGMSRIDDRTRWASHKLRTIGCLDKDQKGILLLTDKGKEFLYRSQQESPRVLNEELWNNAMEYRQNLPS